MAAPRTKNATQRAALTTEVYRRYVSGQSQGAIAAALQLSQVSVSYHVRRAREAAQIEIETRRANRLAELACIRREAWACWEMEKNPVFLAQILKAIAKECSLLGLDAKRSMSASMAIGALPHDTIDTIIGQPQAA